MSTNSTADVSTDLSITDLSITEKSITAIVLCGGAGRRMGGRDKPLEPLHGRPLIDHVHQRLRGQVADLVISCNRNHHRYAAWTMRYVHDAVPGLGPLGGVVSALMHVHTPWAFICPGDAPHLHVELVARLAAACMQAQASSLDNACVAVAHDGQQLQPLFMLVPNSAAASMRAYLARGERSVHGWLALQHTLAVPCTDIASSFANANTPAELAALQPRPGANGAT